MPAPGAKTGLELGDADLARPHPHLGGIGAPVLQVDDGLGRGDVDGNDEGLRQALLDVIDGLAHALGVAVGEVAWSELRRLRSRRSL